jgi:hypothetical protein
MYRKRRLLELPSPVSIFTRLNGRFLGSISSVRLPLLSRLPPDADRTDVHRRVATPKRSIYMRKLAAISGRSRPERRGCHLAGSVRQDLLIPSRPHALIVHWC